MADNSNLFKVNMICRNDLAANWKSSNPILAAGELGLEIDTGMIKIGNGQQSWNEITDYINPQTEDKQFEIQIYASVEDFPNAAEAKDNIFYLAPGTETYHYDMYQRRLHKKTREEEVEVPIEETKDTTTESVTENAKTEETKDTSNNTTTETTTTPENTDTSTSEGSTTETTPEAPKTEIKIITVTYYEYEFDYVSTLDLTNKIENYETLTETTLNNLRSLAAELSQKVQELQIQTISQQDQTTLTTALEQAKAIDSMYNGLTNLIINTNLACNNAIAATVNADIVAKETSDEKQKAIQATSDATNAANDARQATNEAKTLVTDLKDYTEKELPSKIEDKISSRIDNDEKETSIWSGKKLAEQFNVVNKKIDDIIPVNQNNIKNAIGKYAKLSYMDIKDTSTISVGKNATAKALTEDLWNSHYNTTYPNAERIDTLYLKFNNKYDRILVKYVGNGGTIDVTCKCGEQKIAHNCRGGAVNGYMEFYNEYGYWWGSKIQGYKNQNYSGSYETTGINYVMEYSIDEYSSIDGIDIQMTYQKKKAGISILGIYGVLSSNT